MDRLLQHGLQTAADADPDHVAVVDPDRELTYAELDRGSDRLARLLLDLGVAPGDRVGLYLDKSLGALIGLYGVLKAGAAYVPLDPQAPASRVAYIARDCGIRVLVSGAAQAPRWGDLIAEGAALEHIVLPGDRSPAETSDTQVELFDRDALSAFDAAPPGVSIAEGDLAYILYTSGSTGAPKGVMLSHLNGRAFVDWAVKEFGVHADDRLSNHAPLHFDLTVFDLFAASMAGATVVLVPPATSYFPIEVARFIERQRITVWYSVPSILNLLVERGRLQQGQFPQLRLLLFAGEVFPVRYLRRLMELLPHVRFSNLYGPTETNVCTWYDVAPIPATQVTPIPIGRAIADVELSVLTETGARAIPGEVGELHVGGPTVMQGYWGDTEKTARSLVPSPPGAAGDRSYRTGDLVRERPDGNLELLGRRDHQIKTRGYRVELGEIESVLQTHPDVLECAVTATPDPLVTNLLRAHVVTRGEVTQGALVELCASRLPRHMIPDTFEFHDVLPKTSTGKIDRQALRGESTDRGDDRVG